MYPFLKYISSSRWSNKRSEVTNRFECTPACSALRPATFPHQFSTKLLPFVPHTFKLFKYCEYKQGAVKEKNEYDAVLGN